MTIIIVDNDKDILSLLVDILQDEGYKIATANNAPEFMKVADAHKKIPPDLVITDMDMPALNGFGVIHQARRRWGDIPIIIMSGGLRDNPEKMRKCMQETGYIVHKGADFNIDDFKHIVETAVMANSGRKQAVAA